jgi:transposase
MRLSLSRPRSKMGFKRKGRGGSGLSRHVKGQCTKGGKQGGRTPKKKAKHVDVSTAEKAKHAVAEGSDDGDDYDYEQREYREEGGKAPSTGEAGAVYKRGSAKSNDAITKDELYGATIDWLKDNKPKALDSKVEREFRDRGWEIIWTPPYCPRFQPIELVWGVAKQRVAWSYTGKRNMQETHRQLRIGFYGGTIGTGFHRHVWQPTNVAGCWETAKREINRWISMGAEYNDNGITGDLDDFQNIGSGTATGETCLDIDDIDLGDDDDDK